MDTENDTNIESSFHDNATRESTGKVLRGWEFLDDGWIKCGNCARKLVQYIKVTDNPTELRTKAYCPYCNSVSFKVVLEGEYILNPAEGLDILDAEVVDFDVESFTYTETEIRLRKCQT